MKRGRLPGTLTILASYGCTAACENCCFGSHPGITERLPLNAILSYIDQAADLGSVKLVVFSGGECFMLGEELVIAVARCTERRLASRCVTNGYWARSEAIAHERLEPLRRAGLAELNLSTGDFHQEWVPPERIVNAARAAIGLGMRAVIVVESREGRSFSSRHLLNDPRMAEVLRHPLLTIFDSPWMSMDERNGVDHIGSNLANWDNLHQRKPCDSVLGTMVVNPRHELGACCGLTREQIPEMQLGSLLENSMRELIESGGRDLVKIWLAVEGPEHMLAWASTKDPEIKWENRHCHHCDACRAVFHDPRVRKAIAEHGRERQTDLVFRYLAAAPAAATLSGGPAGPEEGGAGA